MKAQLIDRIQVGNTLGEGILWDDREHCVWWTDIEDCRLFRYDPRTRALQHVALPERLGAFGFVGGDDRFVAAFQSGFAYLHPESGSVDWIARVEHGAPHVRLNDGRVDRRGRFWAGSMVEDNGEPAGKLYSLDKGRVEVHRTGIAISNSLCSSPDGHHMYFADTTHRKILRFDAHADGTLSNPTTFVETPAGAFPDGSTVDAEGCVWNAQWGASRVVRYAPNGSVDGEVRLPVTQPTCVAFGGDDLNLLFVTTARLSLGDAALANQPHAGDVFIYRVDVEGLPEARYIAR